MCTSCLAVAIMNFPQAAWSYIIKTSPIGELDPENTSIAVEISFLSCLQAEIYVSFRYGLEATIFIFYFRSGQTAFPMGTVGWVEFLKTFQYIYPIYSCICIICSYILFAVLLSIRQLSKGVHGNHPVVR